MSVPALIPVKQIDREFLFYFKHAVKLKATWEMLKGSKSDKGEKHGVIKQ